jgi:photosystem II stability/assembly factor-like uncharacterized protein
MKKIFLLLAYLLLISNCIYSQTGWFWQNPLPSIHFTKVEFINDQTGFIGGGGYIIKTTNGGINWFSIMGGACSFDIDFVSEQIGYSVDRYCGLYKTTNSGQNWDHLFSSSEFVNPRVYCSW